MRNVSVFRTAVTLALLFLCSCTVKLPANKPIGDPVPGPVASKILDQQIEKTKSVQSLKALYRATITHNERQQSLRYAFIYRYPEDLRVEMLPTTGTFSLGLMISKDGRGQFIDGESGDVIEADSVSELLEDVLRLKSEPSGLVAMLLALLPVKEEGHYHLYSGDQTGYQIFADDKGYNATAAIESGIISGAQVTDGRGRVVVDLRYSDFIQAPPLTVPSKLYINLVRDKVTIEMVLSHLSLNIPVRDELFSFINR